MISQYLENDKKLVKTDINISDTDELAKGTWIEVTSPTNQEIEWLQAKFNVPTEFIMSALDEEETAHIDADDSAKLIVLDVPVYDSTKNSKNAYTTTPFAIIHTEDQFITVSAKEINFVKDFFLKNKKIEPHKIVRLTLLFLYRLATTYITILKKIDAQTKQVEKELHNSMRNKELFDLMELNKSLVYFSTALNSNKIVVHKLTRSPEFQKFEDDFDLIEDTEIEFNQAIEMCSVYRDILAGMMDAFASVISNNLNIVMKVLAVITIVLSIPTLVASFYGMNFNYIPLADSRSGFYIAVIGSLILSVLGAVFLVKMTNKIK
ncbi:MAG: magnesium transporter CorA family protein [Candidatus Izemoplasmatales bacterium]|jgi:magnesium transporter|nr:magnesium transporter CorA family protein [Candidatus Izemoplasmatales bacterium]